MLAAAEVTFRLVIASSLVASLQSSRCCSREAVATVAAEPTWNCCATWLAMQGDCYRRTSGRMLRPMRRRQIAVRSTHSAQWTVVGKNKPADAMDVALALSVLVVEAAVTTA